MPATGHYYILPGTGTIQQQGNSVLAFALIQAGFAGPFPTIADAKAYAQTQVVQNSAHSAGAAASSAAGAVPGFLSRLSSGNTWLRVAEVLLGALLLAVGLNKVLGNPAGNIPKVVPV
jgi:hypothetical protein